MLPEAYLSSELMELETWLAERGYPDELTVLVESMPQLRPQYDGNYIQSLIEYGRRHLMQMVDWSDTPQGLDFWSAVYCGEDTLPAPQNRRGAFSIDDEQLDRIRTEVLRDARNARFRQVRAMTCLTTLE